MEERESNNIEEEPLIGRDDEVARIKRFPKLAKYWSQLNSSFLGKFILLSLKDIRTNKAAFIIGLTSCFVVVVMVALLTTVINYAPIVFLKLAEAETGEIDFRVSTGSWTFRQLLNYSLVEKILEGEQQYSYHTPRFESSATLFPSNKCNPALDPYNPVWKYTGNNTANPLYARTTDVLETENCIFEEENCFPTYCPDAPSFGSEFYIVDSKREDYMQLGREWISQKYPALESGEAYISQGLASEMEIGVGDIFYARINASKLLVHVWHSFVNETTEKIELSVPTDVNLLLKEVIREFVYVPFKVKHIFSGYQGRMSVYISNMVMVEYEYFLSHFTNHLHNWLPEIAVNRLKEIDLYHYADSILWNLPPERIDTYLDPNIEKIQKKLTTFSNEIAYKIGFSQISTAHPVVDSLMQTQILNTFMGLILNVVVLILLFLAVMMIYSLLSISVSAKSYDVAILRSLGMNSKRVIYVLFLHSSTFTLPSLILGLITAQLCSIGVSKLFKKLMFVTLNPVLTGKAILYATVVDISIPILASMVPIYEVVGQSLFYALDRRRSKATSVQITVERSEDQKGAFSLPMTSFGFALFLFGFAMYYLFPLGLLTQNYDILVYVLVVLLMGMLSGMVLLSVNLVNVLTNVLLYAFFFWEKYSVQLMVKRNLITHTQRNRKTSIMYALSLAFIIFLNVSYTIQVQTFLFQQERGGGAYIKVYVGNGAPRMKAFESLEELCANDSRVLDYGFLTGNLIQYLNNTEDMMITNVGHIQKNSVSIRAVSPSYLDATFGHFYENNDDFKEFASGFQLLQELYSVTGSAGAIIGTYDAEIIGIMQNKEDHLILEIQKRQETSYHRLKPIAVANLIPYLTFSKYAIGNQDVIVSFTTFIRLSNGIFSGMDDIPITQFFIKLNQDLSEDEKDSFHDKLQTVITLSQDSSARIWDYKQASSRARLGQQIAFYIFSFAIFIAMMICFFSLFSSMYSNILEQSKEIGMLRAVGTSKFWLYRVYIYEAFLLVFTSSLFGITVGTLIAFTMNIQQSLFQQFDLPFLFPYQLVGVVFGLSIVFSVLSSFSPIRNLLKRDIVSLLTR